MNLSFEGAAFYFSEDLALGTTLVILLQLQNHLSAFPHTSYHPNLLSKQDSSIFQLQRVQQVRIKKISSLATKQQEKGSLLLIRSSRCSLIQVSPFDVAVGRLLHHQALLLQKLLPLRAHLTNLQGSVRLVFFWFFSVAARRLGVAKWKETHPGETRVKLHPGSSTRSYLIAHGCI